MNLSAKANFVFEVSSAEFKAIVSALKKANPELATALSERRRVAIERLFKMLTESSGEENKSLAPSHG